MWFYAASIQEEVDIVTYLFQVSFSLFCCKTAGLWSFLYIFSKNESESEINAT